MEYQIFDKIRLKNGKDGIIVDKMGPDLVVDVGKNNEEYDTILVKPEEVTNVYNDKTCW